MNDSAYTTPGIYTMSAAKYHADPAPTPSLSNSIANVLITQSPKHAWLQHPRLGNAPNSHEDSKFDIGSAAHMMLLERREDGIVRVPYDDWRKKDAQEIRNAARANGQFPILERHYQRTQEMVMAAHGFMATTELPDILTTGLAEKVILWQEGDTWCRSRLDLLSKDHKVILDYKTTENALPEVFIRQIARMGYDQQAEFYPRGMTAITGHEPTFVFLVQETSAPYLCSLVALANEYRVIGRTKFAKALDLWDQCVASKYWPGYPPHIHYAEPPAWAAVDWAAQEEEAVVIDEDASE